VTGERLSAGLTGLLILLGVATIVAGFFVPHSRTDAAPSASVAPRARPPVWPPAPFVARKGAPGAMTYCPGVGCTVEEKARRDCEARPGVFSAEPDFVCRRPDGVHRMVCDDVDDEHQCGMMPWSDLAYARLAFDKYIENKPFTDVDFLADIREGKLVCQETEREIRCVFTWRSMGLPYPEGMLVCNWMGCGVGSDE